MCLSLASLGMSSIVKEDVRSMEIWIDGHPEKYRLDAKNKKLKEDFAAELKKGILKAKENPSTSRIARQPQAFQVSEQTIIYRVFNPLSFRMKISHQILTLSQRRTGADQLSIDPNLWIMKCRENLTDSSHLIQMELWPLGEE